MRKRLIGLFGLLISTATIAQTTSTPEHDHYTNPVIGTGAPDPSVLRAADGVLPQFGCRNMEIAEPYRLDLCAHGI